MTLQIAYPYELTELQKCMDNIECIFSTLESEFKRQTFLNDLNQLLKGACTNA